MFILLSAILAHGVAAMDSESPAAAILQEELMAAFVEEDCFDGHCEDGSDHLNFIQNGAALRRLKSRSVRDKASALEEAPVSRSGTYGEELVTGFSGDNFADEPSISLMQTGAEFVTHGQAKASSHMEIAVGADGSTSTPVQHHRYTDMSSSKGQMVMAADGSFELLK